MRELNVEQLKVLNMDYYKELEDMISTEELCKRYENTLIMMAQLVPQRNSYITTLENRNEQSKKSA